MSDDPPARGTRTDAVRNRARILDATREQIAAHGPDVAMSAIAAAAGVAVGTLYRHFPTKTDLVAAVMTSYVTDVADDARAALRRAHAGASPLAEVTGFLERVTESTAAHHALQAAAAGMGMSALDPRAEEDAADAVAELIRLGQQAGQIAPGITVADVYLLMSTAPADRPVPVRRRWLELVTGGLRASGASS